MNLDKIHPGRAGKKGLSLFAKCDIRKDEPILLICGPIIKMPTIYTIPIEVNLFIDPIPFDNLSRYLCHSCNPNIGVKHRTLLVAFRDITKGEEVVIDYAMIAYKYGSEMTVENRKCYCNDVNCRGQLGCWSELDIDLKNKYQGYVSDYLYHIL